MISHHPASLNGWFLSARLFCDRCPAIENCAARQPGLKICVYHLKENHAGCKFGASSKDIKPLLVTSPLQLLLPPVSLKTLDSRVELICRRISGSCSSLRLMSDTRCRHCRCYYWSQQFTTRCASAVLDERNEPNCSKSKLYLPTCASAITICKPSHRNLFYQTFSIESSHQQLGQLHGAHCAAVGVDTA